MRFNYHLSVPVKPAKKKPLITPEDGAQEERANLKRFAKKLIGGKETADAVLTLIIAHIDKRNAKNKKVAGGLKG